MTLELSPELFARSRETFNAYCALDAPDLPLDHGSELQVRIARWEVREFGYQPATAMALGIGEERGELEDATTRSEEIDALADMTIFAMNLASATRLDFWTLANAQRVVDLSEGSAYINAGAVYTSGYGRINHAVLKASQKIYGLGSGDDEEKYRFMVAEGLCKVAYALKTWALFLGYNLFDLTLPVAEKVMLRRFKTAPKPDAPEAR